MIRLHNSLIEIALIIIILLMLIIIDITMSLLIYFTMNSTINSIMVVFNNIMANLVVANLVFANLVFANFVFVVKDYNIKVEIAFIILALETIIINFKKAYDFVLKGQNLVIHLNKIVDLGSSFSILNLIYFKFFIIC